MKMENQDFQAFIREVKDRTDLVQTISRFVSLKRSGARFVGVCPFHNDHKPSMYVTPALGIYKCFVCGAAGDVIGFIQEHEKISFIEALQYLAQDLGLTLPKSQDSSKNSDYQTLIDIHQEAQIFFEKNLKGSPSTLAYLESRGLEKDTVTRFGLGYAPSGNKLFNQLLSKGFKIEVLKKSGLVKSNFQNQWVDTFSHRLMFPIHNLGSRIIAFGGRALESEQQPKYLNSPETPLYHKSDLLYGLHYSRSAIAQKKDCFLVEGYMDVISLFQAGIKNVCATSGTALTSNQAGLLLRFAETVYICLDGDRAGREAIYRNLPELLKVGIEVKVPDLKADEDPDSLIQSQGADVFLKRLEQSGSLTQFLKNHLAADWKEFSPEKKEKVLKQGLELLQNIKSEFVREIHQNEWFDLLQVNRKSLNLPVNSAKKSLPNQSTPSTQGLNQSYQHVVNTKKLDWKIIQVILFNKELAFYALSKVQIEWVEDSTAREVIDYLFAYIEETGQFEFGEWLERLPPKLKSLVEWIASSEPVASEGLKTEFEKILERMEFEFLQRKIELLRRDVQEGKVDFVEASKQLMMYKQIQVGLGKKL